MNPHLRPFTSSVFKRLYRDQEGILRRYIREKQHWDVHLAKTKAYLLRHLTGKNAQSLAILGSGWLLDIPLQELKQRYKRVYLVDVRHPAQIKRKYGNNPQVTFIRADITGGAAREVQRVRKGRRKLHKMHFQAEDICKAFPETPDHWASVNLLNQLDMLLVSGLEKQGRHNTDQLLALRKHIQQQHLDFLLKRKALLVTDYREQQLDSEGQLLLEKPLVHIPIPRGTDSQEWTWKFDTRQTYHKDRQTYFCVLAKCFF